MVIAAIIACATCAAPAGAYRFALVIGHNDGGPKTGALRYAENDARECAQLLRSHAGFSKRNIELLLHPDSSYLISAADKLSEKIASSGHPENTMLFFYYSGHADHEGLLLGSSRLSFGTVKSMLERMPAGIRVAVFDACQSGGVVAYKGGARAEPFYLTSQQKSRGEVWIASSSANERAQESETLRSSLFSFHLFNGLRGSADVSSDNRVTISESYQYAYRKTVETSALSTGVVQHPVYRFNISGEGDIVLTDFSERRGGIIVDGTCEGTFLVLSRSYTEVYADFYKPEGKETFIALGSGDYTIINARGASDIGMYQFSVRWNQTVRCGASKFRASLAQESRSKGTSAEAEPEIREARPGEEGFSWGAGAGAALRKDAGSTSWHNGGLLSLHGGWSGCKRSGLFVNGYIYPELASGGMDLGIERHGSLNGGLWQMGIGGGFEYMDDRTEREVRPALLLQAGAAVALSSSVSCGLFIPCRLVFGKDKEQRIGFELRMDFCSKSGGSPYLE